MTCQEQFTAFRVLVGEMRAAQTRYFTMGRTPEDLRTCKALEREVDRTIKEMKQSPGLFDHEANEKGQTT